MSEIVTTHALHTAEDVRGAAAEWHRGAHSMRSSGQALWKGGSEGECWAFIPSVELDSVTLFLYSLPWLWLLVLTGLRVHQPEPISNQDFKTWKGKKFISAYSSRSQPIIEISQHRNSGLLHLAFLHSAGPCV